MEHLEPRVAHRLLWICNKAAELEAKCASVLSNLEQRVREEERLQERCQSIMQALDTLMHDPDCGLAIVKQSIV